MPKCHCKTNDGTKCKRKANPASNYSLCTQHQTHDKMRCVSLARKNIGYFNPKTRPTQPRPKNRKK